MAAFILSETTVPPVTAPTSEMVNWLPLFPIAIGARRATGRSAIFTPSLTNPITLPEGHAAAVVGDHAFRAQLTNISVVGLDGIPHTLVTAADGERILRLAANKRWIAWLVGRDKKLLLFVSPFGTTSGEITPTLLETLPEPRVVGDIHLGPDHLGYRTSLFRLSDRARWSLDFLNAPGRGGPLNIVGLTTDTLYWDDWHLRRIAFADLGEPSLPQKDAAAPDGQVEGAKQ